MINTLIKLIPVFYTELDPSLKGVSRGIFIQLSNKYKDDKGLLAHERCHVRQFWKLAILPIIIGLALFFSGYDYGVLAMVLIPLHSLLYTISSKYRYASEIEAYGYSIASGNRSIGNVEWTISNDYDIPLDVRADFKLDIQIAIDNAREDIDELVK